MPRRSTRLTTVLAAAVIGTSLLVTPASAQSVWDGDGPWGPYGWDQASGRFHQPRLAAAIPAAAPLGRHDQQDFDGDGVANLADNCLLVPNSDQRPAAVGTAIGPADMLDLAARWKAENPAARLRTDAELGEACSGYNGNYLRTTRALIKAPDDLKLRVFEYLGQSGPMFGGAANPFPAGKPTSYDQFGALPGAIAPSPTPVEALPQNADGTLANGNMTPSMPMCSGYDQYSGFLRWLTGTDGITAFDQFQQQGGEYYREYEEQFGCGSDMLRPGWEQAMRHGWAGKRLYTNADGGRITNRFVSSISEHPFYGLFITTEPFKTLAEQSGMHPYADDTESPGQSRHGIIFRGRSYIDGRDAILMDWRGFEAAFPLGHGVMIDGVAGNLIYDECRAIQTGVYHCTAVIDPVIGERRHTFQEGYMPWVVKGPPSIDEYIAAVR